MKPNFENFNPSPGYIRELIYDLKINVPTAAKYCGISTNTLYDYLNVNHNSKCPYSVQYLLESL